MHFTKVLPVISLSEFIRRASTVKDFSASQNVHYRVTRFYQDGLYFLRLSSNNPEQARQLDLRELYKALQQLTDFKTENFRPFVPRMHSPGRALLVHLGLIVQNNQEETYLFNSTMPNKDM